MTHGWQRCLTCPHEKRCPKPELNVRHVDGPYVAWCDGQIRWLTIIERIAMFFGRLDIRKLKP